MKRFLLTCLCGWLAIASYAAPITREQARKNAIQFLQKAKGSKRLSPVQNRAKLAPRQSSASTTDTELYYVFNRGDNEGYVLVSGDDRTLPILGYTDEGEFDYNALPVNMRSWLERREQQLLELSKQSEADASGPRRIPVHNAISPMVTTKWNQTDPYNQECPMYFTLGRSVTGCVATALAQVLYFQRVKSVTETQADMPSYTGTTSHETYGKLTVEGIPAGSPIDWDNMLNTYGSSATAKQKLAVAQLMHYCGVAVQMDYTNDQSAAYSYMVADAMKKYFGYGSSVKYASQYNYSEEDWDALLYNELAQGRPFYLSGANSNGGHAFVCDGYDGNHCYHINWGWGGNSDGYFLLNSLNPSSQGVGGTGDGYSQGEEAVIGCEPDNYMEKAMPISNATVKSLCIENWDTNGDGVFSFGEAATVTDLGTVFKGQNITTFTELYNFTGLTSIADDAFNGCVKLTTVTLPKGLQHIGARAFADCRMLRTISLPIGLTSIGESAFSNCRVMGNLTIPLGVTRIEDYTFEKCLGLTSMEMPLGIQYIGTNAFSGCTKLMNFTVKSVSPQDITLGETVFNGINLTKATLNTLQGTRAYFAEAEQWREFGNLYEERNLARGNFATMDTNKQFYIYNVGTGMYLTKGEAYGTQAIVADTDEPMRFEFRRAVKNGQTYHYLYSVDTGSSSNRVLFRTSVDPKVGNGIQACFVNGSLTSNSADAYWAVTATDDTELIYTLQMPSDATGYQANQYLGVQPNHESNFSVPTYGIYSDIDYTQYPQNCQWMLTPYDASAIENYQIAVQLKNLISLAGKRNISAIKEQAIYDNMESTTEEMEKACRKLRKKLSLINFTDETMRAVSIAHYDTNGDDEISYTEAASALYVEDYFTDNTTLVDLSDLQYFLGLDYITGNAFKGCTKLTNVILPQNLTKLYYRCFMSCSKLETVSIAANLTYIGDNVFYGCRNLKEVRIDVPDPAYISLGSNIFSGVTLSKVVLYVPQGSKELYAQTDVWKQFGEIREMRTVAQDTYIELAENTNVYVYNVGQRRSINKGEAWGTQAVGSLNGLIYQLRRTTAMPENTYYLYSEQTGATGKVLFRTSTDNKVGAGIKACFVDGGVTTKAYWKVMPVKGMENVYTLQVPEDDEDYTEGEYLGIQPSHDTDFTYDATYGLYWDISYADNPTGCQWAFSSVEKAAKNQAFFKLTEQLRELLLTANSQNIDVVPEQAVYDNFDSSEEDITAAIRSVRSKLHYIEFLDTRARALCIENWDSNEDEELTAEEAAAVSDIGTIFRTSSIKSFDEFRYFTSITAIPEEAFRGCTSLVSLYLPESVKSLGTKALYNTSALKYMAVLSADAVVDATEASLPSKAIVFVPESLVEAYAADETWGSKNTIKPYTGIPTVVAKDATREYGRTNSGLTYDIEGAPVNGTPTMSSEATTTSPVGRYDIVPTAGTITTSGLVLVSAQLEVTPAPLTITAKSYTRDFGEPNPEFAVTYKTFRNRETYEVLLQQPTIECDATPDSPAGTYEIRVFGAEAQNYAISYENGTLTVVGGPDGISDARADDKAPVIYDLSGRRVEKPVKGLYIVDGRKRLVK